MSARAILVRLSAFGMLALLHFGGYILVTQVALARPASAHWSFATSADGLVPYLAWTWPLYWAAYPFAGLAGAAVLLALPEERFKRALVTIATMIVVCLALQASFPAHSPVPHQAHPGMALIHWSRFEAGFATFPSMHVALSLLTALLARDAFAARWLQGAFAVTAVAVALSTATLGEHVVLDVVAGAALAGLAGLWYRSGAARRAPAPAESRLPDPRRMYRLPWTASDNAMTWLEPTRRCNIVCDACFAENDPRSQKTLAQIQIELEASQRLRRCDAVLVAGGEPLTHPDIEEVVRLVKRSGAKPVIVTNGVLLDPPLLHRLKQAGAYGITLHVDSHQSRPGWAGKGERELNALREDFADMIRDEGGLVCAFNTTVFPDALPEIPEVVRWAAVRADKVHVLTLICVRMIDVAGPFSYYAGGRKVDLGESPYATRTPSSPLTTHDLYAQVLQVLPDFRLSGYLGGTVHPHSLKWVVGSRLACAEHDVGCLGPASLELLQALSHLLRGSYLSYASPLQSRLGKATLLLGLVDRELRRAARRYARLVLRHPRVLFRPLHVQSLSIVQPVDILPNGEMDTCDGCPNRTYWLGRLVPACRLDEYKRFGAPVHAGPLQPSA